VRFDELAAFKLPCDAWVVTDDGQVGRRTLTEWLGVPPDRLWLWRNGVDKARYEAAPGRAAARHLLGVDPDELVVLWASQLTDWKHPERLLDALPELARSVPRLRALIVGDGPERAALERRAERLGVADRVRFEGFVAHDAMVQYYRASDAFVALYDRANVSNTLLEAMLAGLPVVALDNGRTREVVRDGRTGLLVDPERLADLAPTLARILADDLLREALGCGAERWADDNLLSWDERIAREIDAIEDLAARSSATRR
jgi:phosphatidylinositol alpha-1,6-mannosyltransferase